MLPDTQQSQSQITYCMKFAVFLGCSVVQCTMNSSPWWWEAASTPETSVYSNETTRCYIPGDSKTSYSPFWEPEISYIYYIVLLRFPILISCHVDTHLVLLIFTRTKQEWDFDHSIVNSTPSWSYWTFQKKSWKSTGQLPQDMFHSADNLWLLITLNIPQLLN
jgi:hypothetical protein